MPSTSSTCAWLCMLCITICGSLRVVSTRLWCNVCACNMCGRKCLNYHDEVGTCCVLFLICLRFWCGEKSELCMTADVWAVATSSRHTPNLGRKGLCLKNGRLETSALDISPAGSKEHARNNLNLSTLRQLARLQSSGRFQRRTNTWGWGFLTSLARIKFLKNVQQSLDLFIGKRSDHLQFFFLYFLTRQGMSKQNLDTLQQIFLHFIETYEACKVWECENIPKSSFLSIAHHPVWITDLLQSLLGIHCSGSPCPHPSKTWAPMFAHANSFRSSFVQLAGNRVCR